MGPSPAKPQTAIRHQLRELLSRRFSVFFYKKDSRYTLINEMELSDIRQ